MKMGLCMLKCFLQILQLFLRTLSFCSYFLGTNLGREEWKNPAERGLLKLSSSPIVYSPLETLVGRDGSNLRTSDENPNFMAIDFLDRVCELFKSLLVKKMSVSCPFFFTDDLSKQIHTETLPGIR